MRTLVNKTGQGAIVGIVTMLMLFAPFTALTAQAQSVFVSGSGTSISNTGPATASTPSVSAGPSVANTAQATVNPNSQTTAANTAAQQVSNQQNSVDVFIGCRQFSPMGCLNGIIYFFTIGLGSLFAYLAANFFDTAVQLSLSSAAYGLNFVSIGWTTARDFANMAFLFILIYIAFTVIFKAETSGTMSLLAGVIVVALLVNFSFFFSRLAIDAGNILAIEFYNSINVPSIANSPVQNIPIVGTAISAVSANSQEKDLTAGIMNMLQVQNLLNSESFNGASSTGIAVTSIFIFIASAIILWILTVAFATNGLKFLFRIVVLWLLIIASPLAFIAAAVQGFDKGYFKEWRTKLFEHAFYPVAFLFIFLLLTNFANEAASSNAFLGNVFQQIGTGSSSWGAIIGGITGVGIRLALITGLIFTAMHVSDRISVAGAKYADKFGNWVGTGLLKSYNVGYKRAGPGAWAGGVNRALQTGEVSASLFGKQLFRYNSSALAKAGNSTIGREARRYVTEPLATKTRIPGSSGETYTAMKARQEKEAKEAGTNIGSAVQNVKNREDARELSKINDQWNPLDSQIGALEKRLKEIDEVQNTTPGPLARSLATEQTTNKAEVTRLKGLLDPMRGRREQLISNLEKMDGPQVVALNGKDIEGIIQHITDKQLKAVKESTKYQQSEKDKLEEMWNERSKKAPLAESKEQIKKLGEVRDELRNIGYNIGLLPKLSSFVAPGTTATINLSATKGMKKELEDEKDKQEDIRDDRSSDTPAAKAARTQAGQVVKRLTKALDQIKKLEEQVKDVPKDIGGAKSEGEFKKS